MTESSSEDRVLNDFLSEPRLLKRLQFQYAGSSEPDRPQNDYRIVRGTQRQLEKQV